MEIENPLLTEQWVESGEPQLQEILRTNKLIYIFLEHLIATLCIEWVLRVFTQECPFLTIEIALIILKFTRSKYELKC